MKIFSDDADLGPQVKVVCKPSGAFLRVPSPILKCASPVWRAALSDDGHSRSEGEGEQMIEITACDQTIKVLFEILAPQHDRWGLEKVSPENVRELLLLSFQYVLFSSIPKRQNERDKITLWKCSNQV